MNTFLFFRYGNQMLIFLLLLFSKRVQIFSKRVQTEYKFRPILYSSQPIRLQIFFRVNDKRVQHTFF